MGLYTAFFDEATVNPCKTFDATEKELLALLGAVHGLRYDMSGSKAKIVSIDYETKTVVMKAE